MIRNSQTIAPGSVIETDICVIGAGAAGITLALELAGKSLSVTILESGGLELEAATQSLYTGEMAGQPNYPLDACRLRYFGGSTGHWGGWCRPFEPIDFERRDWVPHSGWPIAFDELAKHLPRAHGVCDLIDISYSAKGWVFSDTPPLPLWGDDITTRLIQFSPPTHFGTKYRAEIEQAINIQVLLHANVTSIDVDDNGSRVRGLSVATLDAKKFSVRAKRYVLATGGIENPRLLLASNLVMKNGVGNDRDQVGRYFMDHIQLDCAQVIPFDPKLNFALYQLDARHRPSRPRDTSQQSVGVMGYVALSEGLQRRAKLLNYSAHLYRSYWSDYYLHAENPDNKDKSWWARTSDAINTLWTNLKDASQLAMERLPGRTKTEFYKIMATQEQAPNPSSRVMLADDRDALGMPRVKLDWRFTDLDRFTLMEAVKHIAAGFGGNHLARLHVPLDFTKDALPPYMRGSWHHYGTTRMSGNPANGVVDGNCKVFGLSNLFIAGCSVFPTSGNGNPTLNIVAMAMRLAEHLQATAKQS